MKVQWLSERMVDGAPFAAANLCRHRRKEGRDRSEMDSRCTARVVARTKKHTYAFLFSPKASRMVKKPVWSTPTVVKGVCHRTLSLGSGSGSGFGTVLPLVSRFAVNTAIKFGTLHSGYCFRECD